MHGDVKKYIKTSTTTKKKEKDKAGKETCGLCLVCDGFKASSWVRHYEWYFMRPEGEKGESTLPLDEESEVESELAEALDQALLFNSLSDLDETLYQAYLSDSDSDVEEDLVREMEEELARPLSPLSSIDDSDEDSEGDEARTFLRVPTSTLSGSSSEDSDDETALPSCSRIQSSSDSSSEEGSLLHRVRRNKQKATERQIKQWKYEHEMTQQTDFIQSELSFVN